MDGMDVDVVGAVDGLADAVEGVRSRLASSEGRGVFDVVEPVMLLAATSYDEVANSH
jgi:hypothetical protein